MAKYHHTMYNGFLVRIYDEQPSLVELHEDFFRDLTLRKRMYMAWIANCFFDLYRQGFHRFDNGDAIRYAVEGFLEKAPQRIKKIRDKLSEERYCFESVADICEDIGEQVAWEMKKRKLGLEKALITP